jgi:ATP-dependent helicase/nuclease subunit B
MPSDVLKLRELDPVDWPFGAADRGIFIHGALSEFTKTFAAGLPADPVRALIAIGARHFAALEAYPEARAFWWPRFQRIARWFAGWERERRSHIATLTAESLGKIEIPLGERTFTLRARADRIERFEGGAYAILDYKTGTVPTEKQVRIGISPQLTLKPRSCDVADFPRSPPTARSPIWSMYHPRAAGPRAITRRSISRTARRRPCRARLRQAQSGGRAFRGRDPALSPADPVDVEEPLRHLRPPGAGEGMVGRRRR